MSAAVLPKEFDPDHAMPSPPWLAGRRADALRHLHVTGIPHRRIEEWKYTDLRNALDSGGETEAFLGAQTFEPFAAIDVSQIVTCNGKFDAELSDVTDGVELVNLESADAPEWVRRNLGTVLASRTMGEASLALMQGGFALRVTSQLSAPLHLRALQNLYAVHGRVVIVVEPCVSLTLLQTQAAHSGLANLGMEIVLGENAGLTHIRLAEQAPNAVGVEEIGIRLARNARYRAHYSQAGARLSRVELQAFLEGEGAELELSGTTVLSGKLHADVTTHIEHAAGKTASRQLFKYIVGGQARGVYQGKISVAKGADGSDSRQTAKALLLGNRAEADLKPELEILADDVKCAHGAAIGELDGDSLFYLRSRGIGESEARALLTRAFLEDAVAQIAGEDLRRAVLDFNERALARALESEQ